MKKNIILMALALLIAMPTFAQYRPYGRYHRPYSSGYARVASSARSSYGSPYVYCGFRFGVNGSNISSDDQYLDGDDLLSGLNAGVTLDVMLSPVTPLFFETGVQYTEKGGKGNTHGYRYTYKLNYVEVPLVLKYQVKINNHFAITPFLGGYLAGGVSGKIKDKESRMSEEAFNDYNFRRFDGGLRTGCGIMLDMFYAEIGADIGLANISNDSFDNARNNTIFANIGINF
ncbi:MAG: outer membrane beta-barrel protein [Prevotella sp.]|nr:outer membrane beta-barrel protein [Prevotella sp.]